MSTSTPSFRAPAPPGAQFRTTHWSVVLAAQGEGEAAREALAQLCDQYWYPLYAYVRRRGLEPPDAQDLTQEFFARIIEKQSLQSVASDKGRFRSFLLASIKNLLTNEWQRSQRQKRGGGRSIVSLDEAMAEARYRVEPSDSTTPELLFERSWAATLLERVLAQLADEYASNDKTELFEELKGFLAGDRSSSTYAEVGARHRISEGAVKMAVLRMRQRYGALLREEIGQTVADPGEIDLELRHLFKVWSGDAPSA